MKMIRRVTAILLTAFMVIAMSVPASAEGSEVELTSMHELDSDAIKSMEDGITDSYGKTYSSNVLEFNTSDSAFVTYDLNGAYEKFSASIVCSTNTGSDAKMDVGIFADGVLVYELKGYTRQKAAEAVDLDVSGVGQLSIKTTKTEGGDCYLYFVDSSFTESEQSTMYPNRAGLSDLVVIDSNHSETSGRLFVDAFGNIHNGWTLFDTGYNAYALYNLDKKYVSLSGCIVAGGRTGSEAAMNIKFYLDDKEVYNQEKIMKDTAAIRFELNVTNASVLKIETSVVEPSSDTFLYVADSVLKAHEHKPGEWTVEKEATCTENGQKVQKCTECGEVIDTEKIPATGHKPSGEWETVKEPTCTETGEEVQRCTVCGEIAETRSIDMVSHTPSKGWTTVREATCANEGLRQKVCEVCGQVVEEETLAKTDHDFGEWITVSGSIWNNPIVKERTCSICGEIESMENNPTSWLTPLVVVLCFILLGGLTVIFITLKMNGLPLRPSSVRKLFSKEALSDTDIDNLLNKKDDTKDDTSHKE